MDQDNPTPGGFGNTTGSDVGSGTGAGGTGTTGAGTGVTGSGGGSMGGGSMGGGSSTGGGSTGGGSTGGGSMGGSSIGGSSGSSFSSGDAGADTSVCPTCGQSKNRGLEQFLGRLGITQDMITNLKGQFANVDIDEYMNTAREYLKDGSGKATSYAKDNPGKVAAGVAALALGAGLIYAAANRDKA
ncbi:MAG TPA: hypothetical protein VGF48_00795 [Thermoanaerobaculia bacterium]|jgi:hypothetical protein